MLLAVAALLQACTGGGGGGGGSPPAGNRTTTTCSGAAAQQGAGTFRIAIRANATHCLIDAAVVFANTLNEAVGCAQSLANARYGAGATSTVSSGALRSFFFADYLASGQGGFWCSTFQTTDVDANEALQCTRNNCVNCTWRDITSQVVLPDGSIDGGALGNWCSAHPAP